MVAIIGGAELGLGTASGQVLGGQGQWGSALQGRSNEGVTVNAVTGNLSLRRQDEYLAGRGPDIGAIRTYNSLGLLNDDNGDNWRLGFSRKVYGLTGTVNTAGSTVKRLSEDGAEVTYTYDTARAAYVTTKGNGAYDLLTFSSATNRWTWTDGSSQNKEVYDNANGGRLYQVLDTDGNSLTLGYNAAGLVTSVADANGETTNIDYDTTAGKTTNITQIRTVNSSAATLTRVRYGYDPDTSGTSYRLTSVIVDLSPTDNSITDNKTYVTAYTYDGASRRIATLTQSDGSQLQFTYVQVGADYRIQTVKDVRGTDIRTTTFAYDTTNRKTAVTDTNGQITEFTYFADGQLQAIKLPAVNGVSQLTSFTYDANGNVATVVDARGNTVTYGYDSNGNRILERDTAGNTMTRTFGTLNQLLTETTYTTPDPDGAGAGLPTGAQTTRYVYDSELHLRFVVSPEGRVSEFQYNAVGQQTAAIRYTGNLYSLTGLTDTQSPTEAQLTTWLGSVSKDKSTRVDTTYDVRGQVDTVTTYDSVNTSGAGVVDATTATTKYVYDQAGNLLQNIDARGVATTAVATDYITSYTYDGLGRQLTLTNALGQLTTTVYDDANRKTTLTLANSLVTATTYDQAGNAVSIVRSGVEGALGTTSYTYDKLNRLVAQTDPTGVKTYWIYDAAGRRVGQIDGAGALTEYQYNGANQPSKTIQYSNAVTAATLTAANTDPTALTLAGVRPTADSTKDRISYNLYDTAGRLKKTIDGEGALSEYFYDGANRLTDTIQYSTLLVNMTALAAMTTEIAPTDANATTTAVSASDRRTRQFYSNDGLLLGTLDGEGYLTEHSYDAAGQRIQTIGYATQTASANWATGTLVTLRPALNASQDQINYFLYNSKGQLIGTVNVVANPVSGNKSYLTEIRYDVAGNKSREIRYANSISYTPGQTLTAIRPSAHGEDQKIDYSYDALNQLTREDNLTTGMVITHGYDSVGNRIKTNRATGAAEIRTDTKRFDSLGRVKQELTPEGGKALAALGGSPTQTQIDNVWNQYAISHTYDTAGRRVSTADQLGNKTLFYYDQGGRLTYTINALGEVVAVAYNLFGSISSTRRYGTRLTTATLATLSGGLENATLTNAVTAITNATLDSTESNTAFNRRGQVTTTTDALSNDTVLTYNAFGEVTRRNTKVNSANTRLYEAMIFDRRGQVTLNRRDSSSSGGFVTGATASTQYAYDAFGRVKTTTDPRGKIWTTTYDSLGRTVATTAPGSPSQTMTYDAIGRIRSSQDALGNITTYVYDSAARKLTVTTAEGIVTTTITNRHGETVKITDGRGNITTYAYDDNGQIKTVTSPAGVISHSYNKAGQEFELDVNGVKTAYTYDAASRVLTRAVDPTGLNLVSKTFYDAKGQSIWSQDAKGIWTKTEYDRKGQVTAVIVDPTSIPNTSSTQTAITLVANSTGLNLRTEYAYDARGKTLTVTEGVGSTQPKVTQYSYDKSGRRTQEAVDPTGLNLKTAYTYDANDNVVARTDANNAVTRFVYDDKNQLIYSVDPTGAVVKTDYDAVGRVIKTTAYANPISLTSPSALGLTITAADITGRLTANTATDQTRYNVYDKDGRIRFRIDGNNAVTEQQYDAANNVVQVTRYATAVTNPATVTATTVLTTHADDQTERTIYDAANRALYTIDGESYATQIVYDAAGQVIRQVRYANKLAGTYAVNVAPQIISPTATAPTAAYIRTDAKDITTRTVYDAAGRIRFTLDGENYLTEYRYDALGYTTKTIQYAGTYTTLTDSSTVASITVPGTPATNEPVENRTYDTAGRLVQITDPEGVITRNVYDSAGRITDITVAYGTSEASTAHRVFDKAGRLTEETQAYGSADATTSRYVLDGVGNRVSIIDPRGIELTETDSTWAQTTRVAMNYPALLSGLTAAQKTALLAQYTTTQSFDANGHVLTVTDPLGKTMTTAYDAFGNAVKVTDQRGNSGYFYFDKNNQATWQVDPQNYATKTEYTAFGAVKTVTRYSNLATLSLGADGKPAVGSVPAVTANTAKDQTTQIEHDRRNLQTKITDAEGYFEVMTYDAFSNKAAYQNKKGGIYDYTYDRTGNVKTEKSPTVALDTYDTTTKKYISSDYRIEKEYTYDARGNLTQLIEAKGRLEQRTTNFQYDRLNRQTLKTGDNFVTFNATTQQDDTLTPTEQRFYDKRGNLIEVRVTQQSNVFQRTLSYYDAVNRKIAEVSPLGLLTKWTYNDGTKPVTEQRYTDAVTLPANAGGTPPAPVNAANVRELRYEYDANNRLVKTRQVGVLVGEQPAGASGYSIVTKEVTSTNEYDATGNLVKSVDGRGNATFFYYDKLGRKVAQVDPENFLTWWNYDENGNITQQTQFAYRLSITPDINSNTTTPLYTYVTVNPNPNVVSNDRISEFVYDRMGRIKVQRVLNVTAGSVSLQGVLTTADGIATTQYDYNGLGNVTRQTDALGGVTDLEYDLMGRKTREKRPSHLDHNWVSVTPTTDYQYNGLDLVTREIDRGIDNTGETDDRITQYLYVAGQLVERIDAVDNVADRDIHTYYRYDGANNITRVATPRTDVDGKWYWDYQWIQYNAASQETSRKVVNQVAGTPTLTTLEERETRYNAFGEITGKRLNGGGAGGLWQEVIEYDNAGRAWKSNSGDGVYKLYVYDANGNATLVLNSAGANLGTVTTWAQAFALTDTTQTISQYDKRNLLTNTYQEQGSVTQFATQTITNDYSAGAISVGPEGISTQPTSSATLTQGAAGTYFNGLVIRASTSKMFDAILTGTVNVLVPSHSELGSGNLRVKVTPISGSVRGYETEQIFEKDQVIAVPYNYFVAGGTHQVNGYAGFANKVEVTIYKMTPAGDILLSQSVVDTPFATNANVQENGYERWVDSFASTEKYFRFFSEPAQSDRLVLMYRQEGLNGAWSTQILKPTGSGNFVLNGNVLPADINYEFRYVIQDAAGSVLNTQAGRMKRTAADLSIFQSTIKESGNGLMYTNTNREIHFVGLGANVTKLKLTYRSNGGAWTTTTLSPAMIGGKATKDWFVFSPDAVGLSGACEFKIEAMDANNNVISTATSTATISGTQITVSEDLATGRNFKIVSGSASVVVNSENVTFSQFPANTARIVLMTRESGANQPWTIRTVTGSSMTWDRATWASGINEFRYQALDASGNILDSAAGFLAPSVYSQPFIAKTTLASGGAGQAFMATGGVLHFADQGSSATSMTIQYRASGSNGAWSAAVAAPSAGYGNGWFTFTPTGLSGNYDYLITAKNSSGTAVNRAIGSFSVGDPNSVTDLRGFQGSLNIVHFNSTPVDATTMALSYRVVGSSTWIVPQALTRGLDGRFHWDASALAAGTYEYTYQAKNSAGTVLSAAHGTVLFGTTPQVQSHISDTASQTVPNGWLITGDTGAAVQKRSQTHNAFGEVDSETDGLGRTTYLTYNTLGLLTQKEDPVTNITEENGYLHRASPKTQYRYDLAGRLVATVDANENITTYKLLDGYGIAGDGETRVLQETHLKKDNSVQNASRAKFDVFGDERTQIDGVGNTITQTFDKLGRLTYINLPKHETTVVDGIVQNGYYGFDSFTYDQQGNRISHKKGKVIHHPELGGAWIESGYETSTENMFFDSLGRMTSYKSFTGLTTTYSYTYNTNILGAGGVAVGGYWYVTNQSDGHSSGDNKDYFGRVTFHQDLGGHQYFYTYNQAGWLTRQTSTAGQNIAYDYYGTGYVKSIRDYTENTMTSYAYDVEGNRIQELYARMAPGTNNIKESLQNATATYDELNRLLRIQDGRADIQYEYDANGNRRRIFSTFYDGVTGEEKIEDNWYKYDFQNRFTTSMGRLNSGTGNGIVRGTSIEDNSKYIAIENTKSGVEIGYYDNSFRQTARISSLNENTGVYSISNERYVYSIEGFLTETYVDGTLATLRSNSTDGRNESVWVVGKSNTFRQYNLDNRLEWEEVWADSTLTHTDYFYAANGGPLERTEEKKGSTTITTYYVYEWWDEAKMTAITAQPYNPQAPGWKPGKSHFIYDINGHLKQVDNPSGGRSIRYAMNAQGLVLSRNELVGTVANDGSITNQRLDIYQNYLYFDGHGVGHVGNDHDEKRSYGEELKMMADQQAQAAKETAAARKRKGKAKPTDRYKDWKPITSVDFDQNYQPINSSYPGMAPSSYTVNSGDTLQSIALAVWGDSSMWYLLADANGLSGSEALSPGQVLTVPNKVANIHNNNQTFGVYDAGRAIGDTHPTLPDAPPPPKPKKKKHSFFKKLVVAFVAVVVAIYAPQLLGYLSTFFAGATGVIAGGALASVASQAVAMSLGMQDKFSWSQVATSAIGAGVGYGVGQLSQAGRTLAVMQGEGLAQTVGQSLVGNVATQSIAVASGLQEYFSWTSVAAAGIGAGVSWGVGELIGRAQFGSKEWGFSRAGDKAGIEGVRAANAVRSSYGNSFVRSTVTSLASSGAQAALTGERPNWGLIAAESFGSSLGSVVGNAAVEADQKRQQEEAARREASKLFENGIKVFDDFEPLYKSWWIGGAADATPPQRRDGPAMIPVDARKMEGVADETSIIGKIADWLGIADSPDEIYQTFSLPQAAPKELRDMLDANMQLKADIPLKTFQEAAAKSGFKMSLSSNGIDNSYWQAIGNGSAIAIETNTVVMNIYNPTHGQLDVIETALQIWGVDTAAVAGLKVAANEVVSFNKDNFKENGNTLVFGHSQGTAISNEAVSGLESEVRNSIELYNFGTATGHVPEGLAKYRSIENVRDPVPMVVGNIAGGGGVDTSIGYMREVSRGADYKVVYTDFDVKGGDWTNHSLSPYFADPVSRAAFGFDAITPEKLKLYESGAWVKK